MSEPTLEGLTHQVEIALEEGDLQTASRLLESAQERFGRPPQLELLARRVQEVRQLSRQPTIDSLVRKSQERIRAADYQGALEPLHQALDLAPNDEGLRSLVAQTEKAAARHAAAVERQGLLDAAVREIESLVAAGSNLMAARDRLEQARAEHGRQETFDELGFKIEKALREQRRTQAREQLTRAEKLRADGDWHGAFHQTDQAVALDSQLQEAAHLRALALGQIEQMEGQRHLDETVETAAQDVERLIEAGEVVRAEHRLTQALQELGNHRLFDALALHLDEAKKKKDVRRKGEWAERRAKEAEALLQEAARQALGGHYEEALKKLAAARQMDPELKDLESRERDYRAALEHRRSQQERTRALDAAAREVAAALDGLRLDEARRLLTSARRRFGEHDRWGALESRLRGLREAEEEVDELPTPERLSAYGIAARDAFRGRERTVAAAYSWKQAMLYPARRPAVPVLCALLSALGAWGASFFGGATWLLPVVAIILAPVLIRATLDGKNQPPSPVDWWRGPGTLVDALGLLLFVAVVGLPLWGLRLLVGLELVPPLPTAAWWTSIALLLWLLSVAMVPGSGVAAAFGPRHLWRFGRHARALGSDPPSDAGPWLIADLLFLLVVAAVALRATLAVWAPAMGLPLLALVEGYGAVLVPHLVGVVIRSRRLDWAGAYA